MKNEKITYVIKDQEGNFVSGNRTFMFIEGVWHYLSYTGKSTGYTFFTNRQTVEKELMELEAKNNKFGFGKKFTLEEIDINTVPFGDLIISEIEVAA